MQSAPSIALCVLTAKWLVGLLNPVIGERGRPSRQKSSKCADPTARILQKPTWPELKTAKPGSDQSVNWQCDTYKSY